MPVGCRVSTHDKQVDDPEFVQMKKIIREISKGYNKNDLVRFLMTGSGKAGSRSIADFRTWLELTTGVSVDHMTLADAEYAASIYGHLKKATKTTIFTDEASLRAQMLKIATLPADLLKAHGLDDFYTKASEADAGKELAINKMTNRINVIRSKMDSVTKLSTAKSEAVLAKKGQEVARALAEFKTKVDGNKRTPGKFSDAEIAASSNEHKRLQEEYNDLIDNSNADPGVKFIGLLARRLDGQISTKQMMAQLPNTSGSGINEIIKEVESFTREFQGVAERTARNMRLVVEEDLVGAFGREKAASMAAKIINFKVAETTTPDGVPTYYPHKNMIALFQRIDNMTAVKRHISEGNMDSIREMAQQHMSGSMLERGGSAGAIDMNVLHVLEAYGREMHEQDHAALIGKEATLFIKKMMDLNMIKNKDRASLAYAKSVKTLLKMYMSQILDRKSSTLADEAMGTATAWQVLTKLTSPSTSLTNRLEGVIRYVAHYGMQNMSKLKQLSKDYEPDITQAKKRAQIGFDTGNILDAGMSHTSRAQIAKVASASDMLDHDALVASRAQIQVAKARGLISKSASWGLKALGWEHFENQNRTEAFDLGAAEAAEYVVNNWKARFGRKTGFGGRDIEYLVRNFNLNKADYELAKGRGEKADNARERIWQEFKDKYIVRQGLRGMFQSQIQYSRSARNFLDLDAKTHWVTLFQHYPRSVASTVVWAMHDVKNLFDVGGMKALGRNLKGAGSTKQGSMQEMITLGTLSVMRQALRSSKGLILLNVLSNPISDIIMNIYDYFTDDNEHSKMLKGEELKSGFNQPIRQITGPMMSEVLDVMSLIMIKSGLDDGALPSWLDNTLGGAGLKLNEEQLTNHQTRQYSSARDVVREHLLWDAFAVKDKATNLASSILTMNPGQTGTDFMRMLGVRHDWQVIKQKKGEQAIKNKQREKQDYEGNV